MVDIRLDAASLTRLRYLLRHELAAVSARYMNDTDKDTNTLIRQVYQGEHNDLRNLLEVIEQPLITGGYIDAGTFEGKLGEIKHQGFTPIWIAFIKYADGSVGCEAYFNPNTALSVLTTCMKQKGSQGQLKRVIWEHLPHIPAELDEGEVDGQSGT